MAGNLRSALAVVAVLAATLLAGCGEDDVAIASQNSTLTQLAPTTTSPPATTAAGPATTIEATTTTVYVAPVPGCLDYLDFQIQAGQEDAVELWQDELGESRAELQAYCEELAESDPDRVAEMIEEKRVIDAFLDQVAANEAAAATTEA